MNPRTGNLLYDNHSFCRSARGSFKQICLSIKDFEVIIPRPDQILYVPKKTTRMTHSFFLRTLTLLQEQACSADLCVILKLSL